MEATSEPVRAGDWNPVSAPEPDLIIDVTREAGPVILVVDDDPLLGKVVEACLDFEGAEVRTAHSVADARRSLATDIDHVVLDRRLPDGDGLDLLSDLAERCPDAAVIVFSAYDDGDGPAGLTRVPKANISSLVDLLGLESMGPETVAAAPPTFT
ncbi:MAG: sigma-54 dependent DNA-binding response regulator [Acidimicrobiales bacterium]|nr:sigma-54 dependent DNA-binding response regulator [Acidimicrobiales bacterium]